MVAEVGTSVLTRLGPAQVIRLDRQTGMYLVRRKLDGLEIWVFPADLMPASAG